MLATATTATAAEDLVTRSGVRYKSIDIIETTPLGIKFISEGTTHWVTFKELPDAVAIHYGLEPQKAAALEKKLSEEGDRELIFPDDLSRAEISKAPAAISTAEIIFLDNDIPVVYDDGYFYQLTPWWSYRNGSFRLAAGLKPGSWRWYPNSGYRLGRCQPLTEFDLTGSQDAFDNLSLFLARRKAAAWTGKMKYTAPFAAKQGVADSRDRWNSPFRPEGSSIQTRTKLLIEAHDFDSKAILIEESKTDRSLRVREVKRSPLPITGKGTADPNAKKK